MGTNAGYTPPAQPKCAYDPYMTHAQAVALRDAGGLDPNCVVVITDGPVIGTPGNTSPTQVELNPVGPGDIGRTARIHTNFDNVAFTSRSYNIDGSAAGGDINHLVDHWNNEISDEDAGAPTVHTQFPYHRSGPNLRDNKVNDCTLTGWDTIPAGVVIWDNDLLESGINLTGMGAGQFLRNNLVGSQTVISSPNVLFTSNDIRNSPVTFAGTSALSQSFQSNEVLSGSFEVTAATTARVIASRNVIGGTGTLGFRTLVDGATGTVVTVSGNRMFNQGTDPVAELIIRGAGTVTVQSNDLSATRVAVDGAAGAGPIGISGSRMAGTILTRDVASVGPLTIQSGCTLGACTINVGAANAATTNLIQRSTVQAGLIDLQGPVAGGRNDVDLAHADAADWRVAATATAGIQVSGGYFANGHIQQNRTAGSLSTTFFDCDFRGTPTQITDNGTVDPGVAPGFYRCQFRDSVVNLGSLAARTAGNNAILQQVDMIGSTLNVSGLGTTDFLNKGRLTGCTLTTAFGVQVFEMLGGVKTTTAANADVLYSPAFDNWL